MAPKQPDWCTKCRGNVRQRTVATLRGLAAERREQYGRDSDAAAAMDAGASALIKGIPHRFWFGRADGKCYLCLKRHTPKQAAKRMPKEIYGDVL